MIHFFNDFYDFYSLSPSLSLLGLSRSHLLGIETYCLPAQEDISNNVVIDLLKLKESKSSAFLVNWLQKLSLACLNKDKKFLTKKALLISKQYQKLRKTPGPNLDDFLQAPFVMNTPTPLLPIDYCKQCINKDLDLKNAQKRTDALKVKHTELLEMITIKDTTLSEIKQKININKPMYPV